MRLINVSTLDLEEFYGKNIPAYAILSHTWGEQEVTFAAWNKPHHSSHLQGYQKIHGFCDLVRQRGTSHVWVDTCCIDKSSSAELTEAINSMFEYYRRAETCYVYLADVGGQWTRAQSSNLFVSASNDTLSPHALLEGCRWFTRGWTLQELLAPAILEFYGLSWNYLGSLTDLEKPVAHITGIQEQVFSGSDDEDYLLEDFTIATRMSWASRRSTTRVEDEAYCLLGIFSINMPLLYGEGKNAFVRLQEEIIRRSTDHSIFAWTGRTGYLQNRLLASSPAEYDYIRDREDEIVECYQSVNGWVEPYDLTNRGLQISLPLLPCRVASDRCHAVLNCRFLLDHTGPLAILLEKQRQPLYYESQSNECSEHAIYRLIDARSSYSPLKCTCESTGLGRLSLVHEEDFRGHQKSRITIARDVFNWLQYARREEPVWHKRVLVATTSMYRTQVYPADEWVADRNTWVVNSSRGAIMFGRTLAVVLEAPAAPTERSKKTIEFLIMDPMKHSLCTICFSQDLAQHTIEINTESPRHFCIAPDRLSIEVSLDYEKHMQVEYYTLRLHLQE